MIYNFRVCNSRIPKVTGRYKGPETDFVVYLTIIVWGDEYLNVKTQALLTTQGNIFQNAL